MTVEFKVGDQVTLDKNHPYLIHKDNPTDCKGTVSHSRFNIVRVDWENGTKNVYDPQHLNLVTKRFKKVKGKPTVPSQRKLTIEYVDSSSYRLINVIGFDMHLNEGIANITYREPGEVVKRVNITLKFEDLVKLTFEDKVQGTTNTYNIERGKLKDFHYSKKVPRDYSVSVISN